MPGTVNTHHLDAACGPQIRVAPARADVRVAASNSFGFGGNNGVLIFGSGSAA
jgi:3-oxoacyl-[acyl-carrier-protein] synthase-1